MISQHVSLVRQTLTGRQILAPMFTYLFIIIIILIGCISKGKTTEF